MSQEGLARWGEGPGPLAAHAKGIFIWFFWILGIYNYHFLYKRKRLPTYEERVAHPHLPRYRPLPRRWAAILVSSGLVGAISAPYLAAIEIKAFVWEGYFSIFELWLLVCVMLTTSVELLVEGEHGVMVGLSNNDIKAVPIEEVIKGEKRPQDEMLRLAEVLGI
jgi:hypothetical protein